MKRTVSILVALAAVTAAGVGGYFEGRDAPVRHWLELQRAADSSMTKADAAPRSDDPVVYYRDPGGKPAYSLGPKKAADGREFIPVRSSEENGDASQAAKPPAQASADPTPANGKRVLFYRNPMGLLDTSPTPKKDSMGMDYIPVYEGGDDDSDTLTIAPGKLQRTGVRSEPAERRALVVSVRAPGTIHIDERGMSIVSVRAESFIQAVEPVTTGDRVTKGQPLLRVYSPEVSAAAAQFLSAVNESGGRSAPSVDGARRRLENFAVPPEFMAEIINTHKVPLSIAWAAPRDGVILERAAVEGMRAMPGDALFRLADVSTVWALIDIAERDLPLIAVGQSVTVRPRSFSDRSFTGKITLIYPQINKETRTARVRVELANPDGVLRPDTYLEAEIATGAEAPVVAVPASAVIDSGARQVVIIDKGEGRFEPRPVKLGRRSQDYVEIREGVAEGDAVVVGANFLIDAESNLKASLRGLSHADQQEGQPQ
jgi:Cu(I)/Ag(I) efflux system membrane fusion protein